ncbi:hypothetical protein CIB84_001475 [Bambusicola thoracicus]|uniref:Uncharacterized protein n=1 Tax=Bambusicola thoracicus TaxID=9083 RepID=A0A2P4TEH1_BAMTH|nr:hypothetical protein CIB84_001475 [Bambusicola thoracicus]
MAMGFVHRSLKCSAKFLFAFSMEESVKQFSVLLCRITLYDYQAMCRTNKESSDSAHSLLDPYNAFFAAVKWIMTELVLFLVEFNLCSWWHSDLTAKETDVHENELFHYQQFLYGSSENYNSLSNDVPNYDEKISYMDVYVGQQGLLC